MPASVIAIKTDKTEIKFDCPADDNSCNADKIIKVKTVSVKSDEDKYLYSVSAGKIIGEGADVEWDLTDVKPGTYTITAAINQFRPVFGWQVFGQTKTQIVTVK